MHIAGLARLGNKTDTHPLSDTAEIMMDRSHSQQRGNGDVLVVNSLVAEDKDAGSFIDSFLSSLTEFLDRGRESGGSGGRLPECGDGDAFMIAPHVADSLQFFVQQNRRVDRELCGMFWRFGEKIAPPAERGEERHHQAFTDRINRRIGDLGEKLVEIGVEEAGAEGEHRQRCVITHRADSLGPILDHRLEDHVELFAAVTEGNLTLREIEDIEIPCRNHQFLRLGLGHTHEMIVNHLPVVLPGGKVLLDLFVAEQHSSNCVNGDHLTGSQPPLLDDCLLIESIHPHFGSKAENAVIGDLVPGGAETVAVEAGPDGQTIGKDKCCRSVPRFTETGVVFEESRKLRSDFLITAPGRRHQHGHGVQNGTTRHGHDLDDIVETRGIGTARLDDRLEQIDVRAPEISFQLGFTGLRPVTVAPHRIDLAVVSKHPEGMRQRPGREGIGAITLVIDAKGGLVIRIGKIGIKLLQR